ncbi:Glycosyltransferase, GT2 family [Bifidobacterium bohemicum]|nr:Glycosyltransferase, GT2 family [Bifidobacterium bohemicum]
MSPSRTLEVMGSNGRVDIQRIVGDEVASRPRPSGQLVDGQVAAVIAVESDIRFFAATLRAVFAQSVLPGVILVIDCANGTAPSSRTVFSVGDDSSRKPGSSDSRLRTDGMVDLQLIHVSGAKSFMDAVSKALKRAQLGTAVEALWLLHDDSRPADSHCLESLIEAWRNTPTISLIGAKQLDWDARTLHDVGAYCGRHRLHTLVVDGEPDQEQYDNRGDVFAVSLSGALLPLETLKITGGANPWFGTFGEEADFCRRICLSGGRVTVVPKAGIAHRRARFEGVRSKTGEPLDDGAPSDAAMHRFEAADRYFYTDIAAPLWPLVWLAGLVESLVQAARSLAAKQPYEAWVKLCMPWLMLVSMPMAFMARPRVHGTLKPSSFRHGALAADRHQIAEYRHRRAALISQRHTVLLGPLAKAHLRSRAIRRFSGAAALALLSFAVLAYVDWNVLCKALSGASIASSALLPSAVGFRDLFVAATTPWAFGVGIGTHLPPTAWLVVWLLASVVTLGHPVAALALLLFASAPAMALAFWALAGIFTRSDGVRLAAGLAWFSLGWATGLFQTANLPMLMVMVFLPAGFAFTFRAVGMYVTEDPVRPHCSVQAAACAALCFVPVVCSEPQLLFALFVVFIMFFVVVRSHRTMLLLIPLPAVFALAPTLVGSVRHAQEGAWRQLFSDVMAASSGSYAPQSLNLWGVLIRCLGLPPSLTAHGSFSWGMWSLAAVAVSFVLALLSVVSLFLPSALRVSRLMWGAVASGVLLAFVAVRTAVGVNENGIVGASVLPAFALVMMALIACTCLVAGGAVKRFAALRLTDGQASSAGADVHASTIRKAAARTGRVVLSVALAVGSVIWAGFGLTYHRNTVTSSDAGLPTVAVDYLQRDAGHRILALKAEPGDRVKFSVMRTRRGDLVDASTAAAVNDALGKVDASQQVLATAGARLMSHGDDEAVASIANLGFGGIYVVDDGAANGRDARRKLVGNLNASEGVQSLATTSGGTYYQLSQTIAAKRAVDLRGLNQAQSGLWRSAWVVMLAVVAVIYVLVAIPRFRRFGEEQA